MKRFDVRGRDLPMGIRPVNRGPFGGEPIIFDTLLFVREACQIRRLEVGRPCLAERGLWVGTHRFVFVWGIEWHVACWGTHRMFFNIDMYVDIHLNIDCQFGI